MKKLKGYVALTTVLIVGAVVLVITLSITIIAITGIQTSLSNKQSTESLDIVEACGEIVLREIRNDPAYNAISITLPEGICNLQITESSANYIISIDTIVENHEKSITINADRYSSGVVLNSWRQ